MDLYLIDGNSYVYRAYFAIRGLTDSAGRPTNAIFGFTNMLLKIIRERRPDGVIVSFDTPEPTERHGLFEEYKAHRPEAPDDLVAQFPHIRKIIRAFRIPVYEMPGYEADDILATIAEKASRGGHRVFIVTADKDMYQLIHDSVLVYDPSKDRVLDEGYVMERFGVPPGRVPEFMALVGDAVDNIPGVKGIGDKTARNLLSEFGSLDEILEHPERIARERTRRLIEDNADAARLSRRLAEINRDVPVDVRTEDFRLREPDWQALLALFREYEFTSLMKLVPGGPPSGKDYRAVLDGEEVRALLSSVRGEFAFDTEATGRDPMRDSLVGFSFCKERDRAYYVPLAHSYEGAPPQAPKAGALGALRPLLEDESLPKIGHNLKYDILMLRREGLVTRGPLYDTMIASHLLNPLKSDHSLESASLEHLSRKKLSFAEVAGKKGFETVEVSRAAEYSCDDAELAFELRGVLFEKLRQEGLEGVYSDIEMPLLYVLSDMEEAGVKIDPGTLGALGKELDSRLEGLRKRIYFLAGGEFNINSPRQLGGVLFEGLGLKPGKKKKTGYSTEVGILEELAREHELPREILSYRTLNKLKTTYVDVLPQLINPATGRIHTSFNQTVTATGRLSSTGPNLQNIPIRGEWAQEIRKAFTAEEGNVMISADYSQIELRVLAHLSGDESLVEAFLAGVDVHTRTASELFGVPREAVTAEMRRVAKTVNFGVIYGITPYGLSEALGISREEAEKYITQYFERHPGIRSHMERTISEVKEEGFTRTLFGRKRPIPEIRSRNRATRLLGERLAVNSPVQGTAADVIKIAMINIWRRLREEGMAGRMILQVHDELVVECPASEREAAIEIVREGMQGAAALRVPLKVEMGSGRNWAEAHP
ncbi:MAG: DNA polymerase I [Thermodesulfovibrionales bacterium]